MKRLVLRYFQGVTDLLMHISGLIQFIDDSVVYKFSITSLSDFCLI